MKVALLARQLHKLLSKLARRLRRRRLSRCTACRRRSRLLLGLLLLIALQKLWRLALKHLERPIEDVRHAPCRGRAVGQPLAQISMKELPLLLVRLEVLLGSEARLEAVNNRVDVLAEHLRDRIKVVSQAKLSRSTAVNRLDEIDARVVADALREA